MRCQPKIQPENGFADMVGRIRPEELIGNEIRQF